MRSCSVPVGCTVNTPSAWFWGFSSAVFFRWFPDVWEGGVPCFREHQAEQSLHAAVKSAGDANVSRSLPLGQRQRSQLHRLVEGLIGSGPTGSIGRIFQTQTLRVPTSNVRFFQTQTLRVPTSTLEPRGPHNDAHPCIDRWHGPWSVGPGAPHTCAKLAARTANARIRAWTCAVKLHQTSSDGTGAEHRRRP